MTTQKQRNAARAGAGVEVTLSLPSTLESVDVAEAIVANSARRAGFGEDALHGIALSAREVIVNAVAHGNQYDAGKAVRVLVWQKGQQFGIAVEDEGAGFDLEGVPDPRQGKPLLAAGGRGLCMMRHYMDEVKVERLQPAGTRVSLVKHFEPEAA